MTLHPTITSDYALRAMVELSIADGAVKGHQIHDRQDIPPHYVDNVMSLLRRAGLITARRGNKGGYRLARPASEITVAEIVAATEDLVPPTWITGNGGSSEPTSPFAGTWQSILDPCVAAMRAITLDDLVHQGPPRRRVI